MHCYPFTIFTPTYNRAHTLPMLKTSLEKQDVCGFEWLIIDDGSVDETQDIVEEWKKEDLPFDIHYHKVTNGGKPRAINKACSLAMSEWMYIVDSDDQLVPNTLGYVVDKIAEIADDASFVGVGFLRGHKDGIPLGIVLFEDYVDATNLQRRDYGLDFDCNEIYRVSVLRKFPFVVWKNEKFSPEEIVLNEMALHGYKLRWYNKICVYSEYLEDGMTKGASDLVRNNPMGYAMMFNHRLKYSRELSDMFMNACQFIALCFCSGCISYVAKCNKPWVAVLAMPVGVLLGIRRYQQFKTASKTQVSS